MAGTIKPRDAKELRQAVEWALNDGVTLDVRGQGRVAGVDPGEARAGGALPGRARVQQRHRGSALGERGRDEGPDQARPDHDDPRRHARQR